MNEYPEVPDFDDAIAGAMAGFDPLYRNGSSAPLGAEVVNWRHLADEDAPRAWERLRAWVEWFTVRYDIPISTVPVCWWRHPALVEELSALHTAHQAAFDQSDAGFGPIGWHERLAAAIPRLGRAYAGGCTRGHSPHKPRSWDDVTDEQEWTAWTNRAHAD
jgi:hypothetical protein